MNVAVVDRRIGEAVIVGEAVVRVVRNTRGKVRLRVEAPDGTRISRDEGSAGNEKVLTEPAPRA